MAQDGKKLAYDSEAFAIFDTMKYVKPPIHTLCVGNAWGEAALLLSSGAKVRVQCTTPPHTTSLAEKLKAPQPQLNSGFCRMERSGATGVFTPLQDPSCCNLSSPTRRAERRERRGERGVSTSSDAAARYLCTSVPPADKPRSAARTEVSCGHPRREAPVLTRFVCGCGCGCRGTVPVCRPPPSCSSSPSLRSAGRLRTLRFSARRSARPSCRWYDPLMTLTYHPQSELQTVRGPVEAPVGGREGQQGQTSSMDVVNRGVCG